jgi:hypothetical protein
LAGDVTLRSFFGDALSKRFIDGKPITSELADLLEMMGILTT